MPLENWKLFQIILNLVVLKCVVMRFPAHLLYLLDLIVLQDYSTVQNCSGLLPPSSCYLVDSVKKCMT